MPLGKIVNEGGIFLRFKIVAAYYVCVPGACQLKDDDFLRKATNNDNVRFKSGYKDISTEFKRKARGYSGKSSEPLVIYIFLDAFSHLYKRVCPSVGRSVGPSVRRSHTS